MTSSHALVGAPAPGIGLARLPDALGRCGYAEIAASFQPWSVSPAAWLETAQTLDDPLRAALELLLLGAAIDQERLPEPVAELVPDLVDAGIAVLRDGRVGLQGLGLFRLHGVWLVAQLPQTVPTLYVGDDSIALASRLEVRRGVGLDLCAGPGLQTLVSASRGMTVVAVEVNPVAAALCAVNARINGFADQITVHCADLYAGAVGRYDLVTANPPLLPIPADLPYPFVGDGGPDGFAVTWRILHGLPDHLADGGVAQIIGMTLSDGFVPSPLRDVASWAAATGLDICWTTVSHLPTDADGWWTRGVAATSAAQTGVSSAELVEQRCAELAASYAALGAPFVCTYFLRVTPGAGRLRHVDVSTQRRPSGLWYR
jgi:release factor glutamine methyltransferase